MKKFNTDLLSVNIATFILGFGGLFAKWIDLPAHAITFGRTFFASLFLLLFCIIFKKTSFQKSLHYKSRILFSGLFMSLHWVFFYHAIQVSSVAVGVIAILTLPVTTSLLEPLWNKKPFNKQLIFESGIILVGLYILIKFNTKPISILEGAFWGILCSFSFALRNLITQPLLKEMSSIWVMTCNVIVSSLIFAPISATIVFTTTSSNLVLIIISGIIISGLAQSLFLQSIKTLSVSISSLIASLEVPYAIIASWLFLGEPITPAIIAGGGLIFCVILFKQIQLLRD